MQVIWTEALWVVDKYDCLDLLGESQHVRQ